MISSRSSTRSTALGLGVLLPMMLSLTSAYRVSVVQTAHRPPTFSLQQANQLVDPLSRLLQELDESVLFPLWRPHPHNHQNTAATNPSVAPKGAVATFSVDILESPAAYIINADLPGVSKEDIKVTCENGVLAIQAQRKDGTQKPQEEESSNTAAAATTSNDVAATGTTPTPSSTPTATNDGPTRLVSEVAYGTFQRSFKLPPNTDAEKIEAAMDHRGVLTVTLPKTEPPKEKVILIKDEVAAVKAAA